ncbi:MAG: hypothetical protein IKF97_01455 [Clostridia bacterium]|nr:hypothetical protein [Clostridia bacterium]
MKKLLLKTSGILFLISLFYQKFCYADVGGNGGTLKYIEEARRRAQQQEQMEFIKQMLPIIIAIGIAVIVLVVVSIFVLKRIAKNDNEEKNKI